MTRKTLQAATILAALGAAAPAYPSGFALIEQSVSGLGNAYAGGAAAAEDATTVFFNPAGLSRLQGQQAIVGGQVVTPHARFSNSGSDPALGTRESGDAGVTGVIPNVYYAANLSEGIAVGLGLNSPFGLTTDYSDNWIGRYHALKSQLQTLNINPSLALKLMPNWSVGLGLNAQWLDAKLTNSMDFGLISYSASGFNAAFAPLVHNLDGDAKLTGDSWGYGFNVGTLFEFSADTRLGVSYRSRIDHKIEGRADFTVPTLPAPVSGPVSTAFRDTNADVSLTLPDSASVSLLHRFNPQWAMMADATWTHWSVFKELRVKFNSGLADSVTTESWKDTWRCSLGATFNPSERWAVRAGVAYDQTPVPDASHRTPRIPDNDRYWVALGAGYRVANWLAVDVGYAHLFVKNSEIDKSATDPENGLRGTLSGDYKSSVDIVSAQLNLTF